MLLVDWIHVIHDGDLFLHFHQPIAESITIFVDFLCQYIHGPLVVTSLMHFSLCNKFLSSISVVIGGYSIARLPLPDLVVQHRFQRLSMLPSNGIPCTLGNISCRKIKLVKSPFPFCKHLIPIFDGPINLDFSVL